MTEEEFDEEIEGQDEKNIEASLLINEVNAIRCGLYNTSFEAQIIPIQNPDPIIIKDQEINNSLSSLIKPNNIIMDISDEESDNSNMNATIPPLISHNRNKHKIKPTLKINDSKKKVRAVINSLPDQRTK